MMVQVYLPSYFGSELTEASERFTKVLFHSNWTRKSKEVRKAMLMMLANGKRPLKVTAAGVFEVDFGAFTRICNAAYSLFAFLKNAEV